MTDREKAIIMAYTGACMLRGDKFQIFHKYIEEILGRPIMTHEIGFLADTIKEKAKTDFIALCEKQEPKTDRLYSYLNDMRLGIAPDETTPSDERDKRFAQIEIIDGIMEWIEKESEE